jgi:hypothetical protein
MVPSRIVAQECIAILTTPLLARFLEVLNQYDESWSGRLANRLQVLCDGLTPSVWAIRLNITEAPAAYHALMHGENITLSAILRNGTDRMHLLPAEILMVSRDGTFFTLPDADFQLIAGDRLLVASNQSTRRNLEFTLGNPNELDYVLDGDTASGSWLWQKLNRK